MFRFYRICPTETCREETAMKRDPGNLIFGALAALSFTLAPAAHAQVAPIRTITLFEAGLAEITRETGEQDRITLQVPLGDVNDLLKSLLLRGSGIEGARIVLDGADPVEDAFAALPFPPSAATDLQALLRALPGLSVRVSDRDYPQGHEGRLMDISESCSDERGCETILTILGEENAISRHVFDADLRLAILDDEVTDALAHGLGVLRQTASGTQREVVIMLEGDRIADGALSYVVAAPAWKTAYRALSAPDGDVTIQAWAVIENASGEDWENVGLTLSSGAPNTLTADLHGRDWRVRDQIAGRDASATMNVAMESAMLDALPMGSAARAAPAQVGAGASGAEGVLDSRYAIEKPVDLAAGKMVSLPFLADRFQARHLSLYRGNSQTRTGNPEMMLEITNRLDVRLPAGIMTVTGTDGGYMGDADFPLVAPGETRAVPFGRDRRLRVEESVSQTDRLATLRAFRGQVRVTRDSIRETTYIASSASDTGRDVVIDHPVEEGWSAEILSGPQGRLYQDEEGRRWLRVALALSPDEEGQAARVIIRDTRPLHQHVALSDVSSEMILEWRGQALDEQTEAFIGEVARFSQALSEARRQVARHEATQARLEAEQTRIRDLLEVIPSPSQAHDKLLADLLTLEDRIVEAGDAVSSSIEARHAAENAFAEFLAKD